MDQEGIKHLVLFWRLGRILEEDPGAGIIEEISGGVGRWPRDELGWMC